MDCSKNSHPLSANQTSDEPQNLLCVESLSEAPVSNISGQQEINWSEFRTSLEQHKLQVDKVLQAHKEKIQVALQQQISLHKETVSNLAESMVRDVLMKKNAEITHIHMELENTQQVLQSALQDRDEWKYLAQGTYEMNQMLISLVPPMQATNANVHASSNESNSTNSCNQAMNIGETALENAHPTPICKLCCASDACMLILPCQHLCACKLCVANLNICPICNSAKANVIEARFG